MLRRWLRRDSRIHKREASAANLRRAIINGRHQEYGRAMLRIQGDTPEGVLPRPAGLLVDLVLLPNGLQAATLTLP